MPPLFNRVITGLGIPDGVWDQFHEARVKKDRASANAARAEQKLARCMQSWQKYIPGNLFVKKRLAVKAEKAFITAEELCRQRKEVVSTFDIYAGAKRKETKATVEEALRIICSANKALGNVLASLGRAKKTTKVKELKKEVHSSTLEMLNGILLLKKAKAKNPTLKVARAMRLASEALDAIQTISIALDHYRAGRDELPEFGTAIKSLESAALAVVFAICWQHLWLTRYPDEEHAENPCQNCAEDADQDRAEDHNQNLGYDPKYDPDFDCDPELDHGRKA